MSNLTTRLTWLSCALMALMLSNPAAALSVSLMPNADTYVEFGDADNLAANHGSEALLELGRFSIFSDFAILIRFDLSSIPSGSTINSAILRLVQGPNPYGTSDQFEISTISQDWAENMVNGFTAPGTGAPTTMVTSSSNPVIDVTAFVANWVTDGADNFGLQIQNQGFNNSGNFASREALSNQPLLDITYTVVPVPAAGLLLGAALAFGAPLFGRRRAAHP